MSIYNVVNFFIFFIQASEDDKGKTLVKYHAKKQEFFVLAYSKQKYRGNQAGKNDVKRVLMKFTKKVDRKITHIEIIAY